MLLELEIERIKDCLSDVWDLLLPEEQELVRNNMMIQEFKRGDYLLHEGDEPEFLFALMGGCVKVIVNEKENPQIVRLITKGEIFGYGARYAQNPYQASVVAQTSCTAILVPIKVVDYLLVSNPNVAYRIIHRMMVLLQLTNKHMAHLLKKNLRGRLSNLLNSFFLYFGTEKDGKTLALQLTRDELANMSNMNTGNCIRTLAAFEKEGVIHVDGRSIRLLDKEKLMKICEE